MKAFRLFVLFAILGLVSTAQESMNVSLIYHWEDSSLPASFAHDNVYNEIWGYEKDGREYALIGSTNGLHIHDITDQGSEYEAAFVEGHVTGDLIIHRDYHHYGDHLYAVCDEGASTLQIIDMSTLPDSVSVVYNNNALFPRAHNIFIDSTSARMYVCGGPLGFAIFSLDNPVQPSLLLNASVSVPFWSSIGYVHDAYVENDIAYLNAGETGFYVVDFSDLNDILLLGALTVYPESGYNHSGWLMDNGDYYCMADENHGYDMKILDVSDLTDIQVVDTIETEVHPMSIAHNPIYDGNFLHVSYYHDGYYVWDCSNPESPSVLGYYDTSTETHTNNYRGAWGVYPFLSSGKILVSDMQEGLFVLQIDNLTDSEEELLTETSLTVFPTVASENVFVKLPEVTSNASLLVVNNTGQVVKNRIVNQSSNSTLTLDVGDLASGLYHVVVMTDNGTESAKFVAR